MRRHTFCSECSSLLLGCYGLTRGPNMAATLCALRAMQIMALAETYRVIQCKIQTAKYKYLGTTLDDELDWAENSATLLKKANIRLFFLKKLKSFKVNRELLELFYHNSTESIVTYNCLCFYSSLKKTDKAKLPKVTRTASQLIGSVVAHWLGQW